MSRTTQHTIFTPLAAAIERMPAVVRCGTVSVALQRESGGATWRWSGPHAAGSATLSALSPTASLLTITTDDLSGFAVADALTVGLYGALERQWAQPSEVPAGALALGRRAKIALAAAAVLIPLLAITGMRVLAPPAALDVASAVAQFRQENGAAQDAGSSDRSRDTAARSQRASKATPIRTGGAVRQSQTDKSSAPQRARSGVAADVSDSGRERSRRQQMAAAPTKNQTTSRPRQSTDRRQTAARSEPAATRPEEGVYRYATQGYESIDRPSSRHDYPKETATIIRHSDCGFDLHWQPFKNRWDKMSLCQQGGATFTSTLSTHREFYGQENDSHYECKPGTYAWRAEAGATWSGMCRGGDAVMELRGRTLGREAVQVGDETVNAIHFTIEGRLSGGDAEGTWTATRWIHPDTGLVLRLEAQTNATSQSSVGSVNYREELSLRLLSLTPER